MKVSAVYVVSNTVTGNFYIGASSNVEYRMWRHIKRLRTNSHHNKIMQAEFDTHGDVFICDVIKKVPVDELNKHEQYFIDNFKPQYNLIKKVHSNNSLGYKQPHELKERLKKIRKEYWETHESWTKGRVWTEESKRKLSQSHMGKPAWNKGIPRPQEVRDKIKRFGAANHRAKGVDQYTMDGIFVAHFGSVCEAERLTGFAKSGIFAAANGVQHHSKGFVWKYSTRGPVRGECNDFKL